MAARTIGIEVDDETRERQQALAASKDRSPPWMIERPLTEYVDREEELERERREDEARWERYVLTGEAVDHPSVREWLSGLARGEDAPRSRSRPR